MNPTRSGLYNRDISPFETASRGDFTRGNRVSHSDRFALGSSPYGL